jgi:hypothetical protein
MEVSLLQGEDPIALGPVPHLSPAPILGRVTRGLPCAWQDVSSIPGHKLTDPRSTTILDAAMVDDAEGGSQ